MTLYTDKLMMSRCRCISYPACWYFCSWMSFLQWKFPVITIITKSFQLWTQYLWRHLPPIGQLWQYFGGRIWRLCVSVFRVLDFTDTNVRWIRNSSQFWLAGLRWHRARVTNTVIRSFCRLFTGACWVTATSIAPETDVIQIVRFWHRHRTELFRFATPLSRYIANRCPRAVMPESATRWRRIHVVVTTVRDRIRLDVDGGGCVGAMLGRTLEDAD